MKNAEYHKKLFNRELKGMPLCVKVKNGGRTHTPYDAMLDPEKAIGNAVLEYEKSRQAASDLVPMIESNFMECLIPSLFGAELHRAPGGLIDVRPFIRDIEETEDLESAGLVEGDHCGGVMERACRHLEYIKKNAPDYFYVNPTRPMSPLDYAVVMCGGSFYCDLLAEPELAANFLRKITDVTIRTIHIFKELIGQPQDECATIRGLIYPGIRLTGDAIVNLSPSMITETLCPLFHRFEEEFGKVMLHYCCTPAPSAHVAPALIRGGGIDAIDNWQGYRTLLTPQDYTQTELTVCTDVDAEDILSGKIAEDPFFSRKERPLFTSVSVSSVEEGKRVYEKWRELFV